MRLLPAQKFFAIFAPFGTPPQIFFDKLFKMSSKSSALFQKEHEAGLLSKVALAQTLPTGSSYLGFNQRTLCDNGVDGRITPL